MQLHSFEERDGFITLHYRLSWPTSWEGIVSFLTVAGADMKESAQWPNIHVELAERDITEEFRQADGNACECPSIHTEARAVRISGISRALNVPVRITLWNQTDSCTLLFPSPLAAGGSSSELGIDPLMYDRYMDALEILSHRDRARRQRAAS